MNMHHGIKAKPKYKRSIAPKLKADRLPPQEIEVEERILGALLLEDSCYDKVSDILRPESFYMEKNQVIYACIAGLKDKASKVDLLFVKKALEESNQLDLIGGVSYLARITSEATATLNVRSHALIVVKKFVQREIIRVLTHSLNQSFNDDKDVFDLLESTEGEISEIATDNFQSSFLFMPELIEAAKAEIKDGRKTAVFSGFKGLDEMTAGWLPGQLLILAARPAMGKTAMALNIVMNMVLEQKLPVAVFSLEMSSVALVTRLLTSVTGIDAEKIKKGRLSKSEWVQLNTKVSALEQAPLYIDDTPGLSMMELKGKGKKLVDRYGIKMIIIDYLQLMHGGKDKFSNRQEEISYISRELKKLSKELNLPVLALSQLSRMTESRQAGPDGKKGKPQLSDLRESGAIEQDADMVMFIYRPEYYGLTADENNNSLIGITELGVAKHRSGERGDIPLRFIPKIGKFQDIDISTFPASENPEFPMSGDEVPMISFQSKMNNEQSLNEQGIYPF